MKIEYQILEELEKEALSLPALVEKINAGDNYCTHCGSETNSYTETLEEVQYALRALEEANEVVSTSDFRYEIVTWQ